MSENDVPPEGGSEDEKLASEWESAMEESGDSEGGAEDEWAAAMAEAEAVEKSASDDIKSAPLESFAASSKHQQVEGSPDLDVILDIPVTISMEVGNTSIPIRNLLQLNQGSVIELDRLAGEPLDVLINGTLIAHGEVVMVNDKFGIRLTDVVSPTERIRRLS
ncbi:MAG: flagellar motor switch protein FliN/FliY [Pseudohongiellaceae bacterium]|jgi:flagellar motor switch protein FliN/FliY